MFLYRKLKNCICKKYHQDIFGDVLLNARKKIKLARKLRRRIRYRERYIPNMRVDIVEPVKKRRRVTSAYYNYRMKRQMRLFYGTIKYEQFRKVLGSVHRCKRFFFK